MTKYRYVFVVLVYRNMDDLEELIVSIRQEVKNSYKIIVVNSFYDEASDAAISRLSHDLGCDFISVVNKGYGYGNNQGIDAAMAYDFDYVIVSNPDIILKKWEDDVFVNFSGIIGPLITTSKGIKQNPFWAIENKMGEWLLYEGFKKNRRLLLLFGWSINYLIRLLFQLRFSLSKEKELKVFALHGSFIVFTHEAIKAIGRPFDEQVFLYYEEAYLAHKAKRHNVPMTLTKSIEVFHKEDGSVSLSAINQNDIIRKSYLKYYENLKRRGV